MRDPLRHLPHGRGLPLRPSLLLSRRRGVGHNMVPRRVAQRVHFLQNLQVDRHRHRLHRLHRLLTRALRVDQAGSSR